MCNVHFVRAVLKNIPKKDKKEVAYMLKDALEDESVFADSILTPLYKEKPIRF